MTSDSESRVTRSKRSIGFAIALFAGGVVAATGLGAQETPAPVPPAPAAAPGNAPASTAPAVPQPQPADAKSLPAGASRGTTSGGSKDHFEPTEKVRADFDVSFPVDI
jgi:hypothetical protein